MTDAEFIERMRALLVEYDAPSAEPTPEPTFIPSGGNISSVLEMGASLVRLEAGGHYERVIIERPVAMYCNGATLHGADRPAVHLKPGPNTVDITLFDAIADATFQSIYQLGDNGATQVRLSDVPRRIRLVRPLVLTHGHAQAKNAIENNASDVEILQPEIRDVYNSEGIESHGIITINTPGGLRVIGGLVSGASTPFFTGGDAIDIPETDIADVTYDGVTITRPPAWQTDGIKRNIKNLIEFKNVTRATVTNCILYGNWGPVQRGFAVMLTPKVDGRVVNVEFSHNSIDRVGGGFNVAGVNPTGLDATRTDDIRILDNVVVIDKTTYVGSGWFLLLQDGPGRIVVARNTIRHNGNALVYVDDRDRIASLVMRGNDADVGAYGIRTPAGNNGDNWQQVFDELIVEENTFRGASSAFKRNFPNNIYV